MGRLREVMLRELTPRNKAGAYVAMLTCPCHVGVLLFLTAGTVFGAWLGRYNSMLYSVAAVLFIFGVWTMFRPDQSCPIPPAKTRN